MAAGRARRCTRPSRRVRRSTWKAARGRPRSSRSSRCAPTRSRSRTSRQLPTTNSQPPRQIVLGVGSWRFWELFLVQGTDVVDDVPDVLVLQHVLPRDHVEVGTDAVLDVV